jgi:hypothetical protein
MSRSCWTADNTVLDEDRVQADRRAHLARELGPWSRDCIGDPANSRVVRRPRAGRA